MSREKFKEIFGTDPALYVEAPGRTELGGNHTDHQRGLVICSPVSLKMKAWVRPSEDETVRVYSEGYGMTGISLAEPEAKECEYGTSAALVRGITADFAGEGLKGFDAYITSGVPAGSGLSSSAALEILLGRICCRVTGAERTWVQLAQLGQKAENIYFNKPCGLMDQMACAAGGIIAIDFADPKTPKVRELPFSFLEHGYNVCVIQSGAGHEDMTDEYASITRELSAICGAFGRKVLRDVPEEDFYARISELRKTCGDRAVLRAMHVYDENRRVSEMMGALENGDMDRYLGLVKASGRSSWELLQNVVPAGASAHQEMAAAIALAERELGGRGAVRVHGGGFAGTIQAYVPADMQDSFAEAMDRFLGASACVYLNI